MSKKEKLLKKLLSHSNGFTFNEMNSLLESFGYTCDSKGKTSSSRVRYYRSSRDTILVHKPHPRKTLLSYQVKGVVEHLKKEHLL